MAAAIARRPACELDRPLKKAEGVVHLLAHRLENLDALLSGLDKRSRDFH